MVEKKEVRGTKDSWQSTRNKLKWAAEEEEEVDNSRVPMDEVPMTWASQLWSGGFDNNEVSSNVH